MVTNKFAVRYYAGKTDIQEYRLKDSGAGLFPEDIAYSLRDRKGIFSDGVFSVHYGESAYILSCLVSLMPDSGFRDNRFQISVAMLRGYELAHPFEVFDKLSCEFKNLVNAYGDDIAQALFYNTSKIEDIVSEDIVRNQEQPVYDCAAGRKAVTAYRRKEEAVSLMSHPSRPQFEGFSELIVLPQSQAAEAWPELHQMGFMSVTNVEYPYRRTYKLRYPDGSVETIEGLEHVVDRVCRQPHSAPLVFKGRLSEHVGDWQIALNHGKTEYVIGRDFEWEYKSYVIESKDGHGSICNGVEYNSSIGVVKGRQLILRGPEIDLVPKLTLRENCQWKLISQSVEAEDRIVVRLAKINIYDVSSLWRDVKKKVGENKPLAITLINTKTGEGICTFLKDKLAIYYDLPYLQAAYKIDDGGKHEICYVPLASDGTPGSYELKEKAKDSESPADKTNGNRRIRAAEIAAVIMFILCVVLSSVLLSVIRGRGDMGKLQAENQSLLENVSELLSKNLKKENSELQDRISELSKASSTAGAEPRQKKQSRKEKEERDELIEKLRGTSFTMSDITKLKGMGNLNKEEQALVSSCEACFHLLNAPLTYKDNNDKQHDI